MKKTDSSNLSKLVRGALLIRDGDHCHYCGVKLTVGISGFNPTGLSIDHVVPIRDGGSDEMDNLVLACRQCNLEKRTLSYHEFQLTKQTDLIIKFFMDGEE